MNLFNRNSIIFLGALINILPAYANGGPSNQSQPFINIEASTDAELKKQDLLSEKKEQIIKEAADAANSAQSAIRALNDNNTKQAKAALEVAIGNVLLLMSNNPGLDLIPIDAQAKTFHSNTDMQHLKKLQDQVDTLIENHGYQAARPLIDTMADEIRIHAVYLPLKTFAPALNTVVPLLDKGEISKAKAALYSALGQLVYKEEVIPLAILRTEAFLLAAFQLEQTNDLTKQETKDSIGRLLESAGNQLKLSEQMGYGVKSDYEDMTDSLDSLKKVTDLGGFDVAINKFKQAVTEFKHKLVRTEG